MSNLANLSFEDIAFEICSAFDRAGVIAVLSGGGAATIYAPKAYRTRDFDFVLHLELFGMPDDAPLRELGFEPSRAAGTYAHPEITYTLEILHGPLGVGEEVIQSWETRRKGEKVLHILSALNSAKDRLASAIHFNDLNAARQAAEIAKLHVIDLKALKAWCHAEGGAQTYAIFETFLHA